MRALAVVVVVALTGAGCGGGRAGDDAPDADPGPPEPQFGERPNRVVISELRWNSQRSSGNIGATFERGGDDLYAEAARSGSCRLLTSDASYCSVECNGFCVDNVCREFPTYHSAGTIHVSGLWEPVTLTYRSGYYEIDPFPVPSDMFAEGDPITATAVGDEVPAFTISGRGVATLSANLTGACDNELHIQRGQDAVITWDKVGGSRVRLRIPSPNNGHGMPSRAVIECEGPDTGQFRVPSAMIDAMPDFVETNGCDGIACVGIDCPPSSLERYTSTTATAGTVPVVLDVESHVTFQVYDN